MNWTKNRPTQPGWYWWRLGTDAAQIIYFEQLTDRLLVPISRDLYLIGVQLDPRSEWAGPLEEPEEEQHEKCGTTP